MIKAKKITIIALLLVFFTVGITLFCVANKKTDIIKAETSLSGMDFSKSNGFQLEDALTGSPKTKAFLGYTKGRRFKSAQ